MRHLPLSKLLAGIVVLAACSSTGPASYPDRNRVVSAQAAWCDTLDKMHKDPGPWSRLAECKAAFPAASAPYLKGMAKCFFERVQREGENAPDNTQIVEECNGEAVAFMKGEESAGSELIDARCKRMERCEKVAIAECKTAIEKLDAATRAELTTKYNAAALHEVADCLSSASCTDDEDSARQACYKPQADKLLWFP
jgi:hypothetical protein